MKLKTRIISLFLTVLMIVGLLPMSLFAVDGKASTAAGDEKYEGTKWTAPDLEDIVNAFYPDIDDPYNSSNWRKYLLRKIFLRWRGTDLLIPEPTVRKETLIFSRVTPKM